MTAPLGTAPEPGPPIRMGYVLGVVAFLLTAGAIGWGRHVDEQHTAEVAVRERADAEEVARRREDIQHIDDRLADIEKQLIVIAAAATRQLCAAPPRETP